MSFNHPLTSIPGTVGNIGMPGDKGAVGPNAYANSGSTFNTKFLVPDGREATVVNGVIKSLTQAQQSITKYWVPRLDNTWWTNSQDIWEPPVWNTYSETDGNQISQFIPITTGINANWNLTARPEKLRIYLKYPDSFNCRVYTDATTYTSYSSNYNYLEISLDITKSIFKLWFQYSGNYSDALFSALDFWDVAPVGMCIKQYCVGTDLWGTYTTSTIDVFQEQLIQANSTTCGGTGPLPTGQNHVTLPTKVRFNNPGNITSSNPYWVVTNAQRFGLTYEKCGSFISNISNPITFTITMVNLPTNLTNIVFYLSTNFYGPFTFFVVALSAMTVVDLGSSKYEVSVNLSSLTTKQYINAFEMIFVSATTSFTLSDIKY